MTLFRTITLALFGWVLQLFAANADLFIRNDVAGEYHFGDGSPQTDIFTGAGRDGGETPVPNQVSMELPPAWRWMDCFITLS